MVKENYRLRSNGCNQIIVRRLYDEIGKLDEQLSRLQVREDPYRFSLMKTYKVMIKSRQELISQISGTGLFAHSLYQTEQAH